jgi:chaperone modulatory protein CbpM
MNDQYTAEQAVATVARLTLGRLTSFVEAEIVTPMQTEGGQVFRQVDLVRMELLCELSEDFDLDDDSLALVISLVDQLHGARGTLRAVLEAIEAESEEVRARIARAIRRAQSAG